MNLKSKDLSGAGVDPMRPATKLRRVCMALAICLACATPCLAQEPPQDQDPASATNVIQATLDKIREVEQLDKYIAENTTLKTENLTLKQQIASLNKQIQELTKNVAQLNDELKSENERLRKQLVELPGFEVKSKILMGEDGLAVLASGGKNFRVRSNVEMSIPAANGVWVLMKVEKITTDVVQLNFPELDRTIVIYD